MLGESSFEREKEKNNSPRGTLGSTEVMKAKRARFPTIFHATVATRISSCARAQLCTTDSCARFESLTSLAGNSTIFPPKHQLRKHKEEDCQVSIETPQDPTNNHHTTPQRLTPILTLMTPPNEALLYCQAPLWVA